jgi:putative protease
MRSGIEFAHSKGVKVLVAINTYPQAGQAELWKEAVDQSAGCGADAVILADIGLIAYAARRHPNLRRHLSVQASASNAESIRFFVREFDVKRVVLPRVLTVEEIKVLNQHIPAETEVFVFGGMCVMAEGRCSLSSYVTGQSPNMNGVCSPACAVRFEQSGGKRVSRLGEFAIDEVECGAPAGYPTICKGKYIVRGERTHIFEEPVSLSAASILPRLLSAGVSAIKIEGRQRGKAYIAEVVSSFRRSIDAMTRGDALPVHDHGGLAEGGRETAGAYRKAWR